MSCLLPSRGMFRNTSRKTIPPAMQNAVSARLKTGQFFRCRKSTTCPRMKPGERKIRSVRFPSAPPRTRPNTRAHQVLPSRFAVRRTTAMTTSDSRLNTTVMPTPMPNAAPALRVKSSWNRSPTISTEVPSSSLATARILVIRSAA